MSAGGIGVQRIGSPDEFDGFRDEWNDLHRACPEKHVLLDHRWVSAWWRHFGAGKALHVLRLRRGSDTVAIAPLVISRGREAFPTRDSAIQIADDYRFVPATRWRRVVPVRRLTFPLSTSSSNARAHILTAEADPGIFTAILEYCRSIAGQWDLMMLEGLPRTSGQAEWFREQAPSTGLSVAATRLSREFLHTELPSTYDEFLSRRTRHFRKRLRDECRHAEARVVASGELQILEFRGASTVEGLETMYWLETQSWKVKKERTRRVHIALDDRMRSFHRDVATSFGSTDEAQVLVLQVGNQPAAGLYSLEREGTALTVLTYMSEELATVLTTAPLWQAFIQRAIARGIREIDFNGSTASVRKWGDDVRLYERVVLFNRRPYSRLLGAIADTAHALSHLLGGRPTPVKAHAAGIEEHAA